MRAEEFLAENKQATAQQVLGYVNKTHHEPLTAKLSKAVLVHPRWELTQIPLSQLHIPEEEYDDEDQTPKTDPYNRVMAVDPDHANEYSTQVVDQHPIVVDDQGYIIDGNHRAWAAAELLNRDRIQAWAPVKQDMAENFADGKVLDPDLYGEMLPTSTIKRIVAGVMNQVDPDAKISVKQSPEGYYIVRGEKLRLDFGITADGGEISANVANAYSSYKGAGVVTKIFAQCFQAAEQLWGKPIKFVVSVQQDRGDGVWQAMAKKLGAEWGGSVMENFADGKVKGKSRPGRVKRAGASCNGSVTDLRKRAKNASGEKARMYHWCANMKSGRKK